MNKLPKPSVSSHSRRRFLTSALAAAAAPLLPRRLRADGKPVVVIGAGLSGLYAALTLEAQGFEVTVLEARDRIGGRLYTLDDVPGHPEAGGNTIGPN